MVNYKKGGILLSERWPYYNCFQFTSAHIDINLSAQFAIFRFNISHPDTYFTYRRHRSGCNNSDFHTLGIHQVISMTSDSTVLHFKTN